jgi:hypothetical protein
VAGDGDFGGRGDRRVRGVLSVDRQRGRRREETSTPRCCGQPQRWVSTG